MAIKTDYTDLGGIRNDHGDWIWQNYLGRLHREDGPAIVRPNGSQEWYLRGELHRTNGPAFVSADGHQEWYVHGRRHRADGPAIIGADGRQAWYVHGRRHRADGPAIVYADGRQEWYLHGGDITTEVEEWMRSGGITIPFTKEQQAEFALRWL